MYALLNFQLVKRFMNRADVLVFRRVSDSASKGVLDVLTMLYVSKWWAVNKADLQQIDALDQCFLRRILGIHWHDFARNADGRHTTKQVAQLWQRHRATRVGDF